ncbi:hypothetical protein CLV56_0768 [Mumia flava]|uniref:Enoyl reductase (ER) domain-containing protein n=1 Tax=Mumia flava TaxID=1348852 RepID=A0A0B2BPU5_9ACTN|nr:NADP-dependent oxidoreductase [Mumia flava]PJJ56559.1 hypothetical protein CLV56_0768 [Mumia flava]
MTTPTSVRAVVLRRRPDGLPRTDDVTVTVTDLPERGVEDVLLGVADLSLDPYLRSTLAGTHLDDPAVAIGGVVPGRSVARVLASDDPTVPVGTWVVAETGWRSHAVVPARAVRPVSVPTGVRPSAALGALGMPGLTAYAAIERHLRPGRGETVVVSAATGGVGAVAGALARARGARTVAITGSSAKADDALGLGYDAAVVRGEDGWTGALRRACPERVDCYLHMGDQATLDGVLAQLSLGARVSLCGLMDQYNGAGRTTLPAGTIMAARAQVHGMVVHDHGDLEPAFVDAVGALLRTGGLRLHEERHRGLESAGAAFARLMAGHNRGKVVVEVDPDPR